MPLIKVVIPEVEALSIKANSVADAIEENLASLTGIVNEIVGGSWVGDDAAGFGAGFSEWQSGASAVQASLQAIAALLLRSGTTYTEVESGLAAELSP